MLRGNFVHISMLTAGGKSYDVDPQIWADRVEELADNYTWGYAEDPGVMSLVGSIQMTGWSNSLRFWPDSDLVLLHQLNQDIWFRAEPKNGMPSVFSLAQTWYDIAAES